MTTQPTSAGAGLSRRQFVVTTAVVGGAFAIGVNPVNKAKAAIAPDSPWEQSPGADFTAYITIAPDNTVTVRGTTPDMGNGTFTAAPMFATEELHCDWDLVTGEYIPANRDLREGGVYSASGALAYFAGRSTGQETYEAISQAAASARERLRHAAAERWGVPVEEVVAEKSILSHTGSDQTLTFGDVAEVAAGIELDEEPAIKQRSEWTFLGKESPKMLQLPSILDGSAQYGMDVQVPGMVYAALRQAPVHGGRLVSYDFDAIRDMPGVRDVVVVDPSEPRPGLPEGVAAPFGMSATTNGPQAAVAVIADHYWQAKVALDLLPVEWDAGEGAQWTNTQTIYDGLREALANPTEANVVREIGDVDAELASGQRIDSEFMTPYQDHILMESLNGTALVTDDRVEMWVPTQHPQQALYLAADETGVAPENVHINATWIGVGFGRRVYGDDMRMIAAVANKVRGTPVKVMWSCEETTRQGRYRALHGANFSASLDDEGMPKALSIIAGGAGPNGRNLSDTPYQHGIPNFRVQLQRFNSNLMTGPWRGPIFNSNCFFLETFISECAETAGIDAIEYRRRLLANYEDGAWIRLLDEVAEKSNWGEELPRGMGKGVAIGNWAMATSSEGAPVPFTGSTVATVVTVEVTRRGEIYIPRVDLAFDIGTYINEDHVRKQMEGGVIVGLSGALFEEINVNNGAVVEGNLDSYRVMRQNDAALPEEIHVHFGANSGHERMSEVGEPPVGPPPAALAHAIYRATGRWVRRHPFMKEDLSWS